MRSRWGFPVAIWVCLFLKSWKNGWQKGALPLSVRIEYASQKMALSCAAFYLILHSFIFPLSWKQTSRVRWHQIWCSPAHQWGCSPSSLRYSHQPDFRTPYWKVIRAVRAFEILQVPWKVPSLSMTAVVLLLTKLIPESSALRPNCSNQNKSFAQ